jgi:hypothetical protein
VTLWYKSDTLQDMGCWGLVLGQDRFLLMEFLLIDKWGNYFAKLNKTKNTTTLNIAQLFKSLFYYFSGLQWQRITCKLYMLHMSKNSKQNFKNWNSINEIFLFRFMVSCATFNNISVISWRSALLVEETTDMSQVTDKLYHILLYRVHLARAGFELTTSVVIGTDCIRNCTSNYHMIMATTATFSL